MNTTIISGKNEARIEVKAGENILGAIGRKNLRRIIVRTTSKIGLTLMKGSNSSRHSTEVAHGDDYDAIKQSEAGVYQFAANSVIQKPNGVIGGITGVIFDEDTEATIIYE